MAGRNDNRNIHGDILGDLRRQIREFLSVKLIHHPVVGDLELPFEFFRSLPIQP